eukprot:3106776-Prymnesium_polylepis.1
MLQKEATHHAVFTHGDITISHVWRSVIRTVGSGLDGAYKRQHTRVMDKVAAHIGRGPPTIIVAGMYAFDAQWQGPNEVSLRMRALFKGFNERYGSSARKLTLGPVSYTHLRAHETLMNH